MKISILILTAMLALSCGKTNKVNTNGETGTINTISTNFTQFEGNYDLIRMKSEDCGASIQIVRECNGLMLLSNHLGPEEFCNINQGTIKNRTVTLRGNELKSVMSVSENDRINFSSTLTLNNDGTLAKISNFKSRQSRCLYLKR
ncbi:MAG: hypothetical protein WC635_05195 [Bacteriovorax sp.]|jgi:hypothetical protein